MRPKLALVFIFLCQKGYAQIGPSYCLARGYKVARDGLTVASLRVTGCGLRLARAEVANTLRVERTERLEGSQTSPRRLKLRETTSGSPPGPWGCGSARDASG
jgi:hypothetical protein